MSGVQANWHLDGLELPEGDPMQEIAELKSRASVIDLAPAKSVEQIREEFAASLRYENGHAALGLACSMKWTQRGPRGPHDDRNPCYECPHFTADAENEARALLCTLGRRQNDLLAMLDAAEAQERLDAELAAAYETDVAACEEMAAALV